MAGEIIPEDNIIPSPSGSTGTNYSYVISDTNLAVLAPTAQSSLLAAANLGSAVTSVINSSLDLIRSYEDLQTYLLDNSLLNSLASGSATSNYAYTNTSNKFVRVIIILGTMTPAAATPKVLLRKGTDVYEIVIPSGTDQKRIEFNNIPIAFVSSFQVENQTGTTFASSGNSIIVQGL